MSIFECFCIVLVGLYVAINVTLIYVAIGSVWRGVIRNLIDVQSIKRFDGDVLKKIWKYEYEKE